MFSKKTQMTSITLLLVLTLSVIALTLASKAQVDLFVMSKCSDTQDFYKKVFFPLLNELDDIMEVKLNFIARVNSSDPLGFSSLHGPTEVVGDLWEVCAQNYFNASNEHMNLVICVNNGMRDIPLNMIPCSKSAQLDTDKLLACSRSDLGKQLLTESIKGTDERQIRWAPTMWLNGNPFCEYGGGPCKANNFHDFVKAVCEASTLTTKPAACY